MNLVSPEGFQGSYEVMTQVIQALEYNAKYRLKVLGEPQLGRRGLYPTLSHKGNHDEVAAMLDFTAYADGQNDLIDISKILGVPIKILVDIVEKLSAHDLLEKAE